MATTFFGSLANALENISFHALGNYVYFALIDVKRNFERNIPFKWFVTLVWFTWKSILKGHSQLWDRADVDTSFASLKSVYLNLKLNVRVGYI